MTRGAPQPLMHMLLLLTHLDGAVDGADEGEGGQVACDGRDEGEDGRHQAHVAKVQQLGHRALNVQVDLVVKDAVGIQVDAARAGHEHGWPPPAVVLCIELGVGWFVGIVGAGQG